jgi:Clathrin adaptor complex small chain
VVASHAGLKFGLPIGRADATLSRSGAASAIFILDLKGKVLLSRDYRGDVPVKFAERFITKLSVLEEAGQLSPIIYDDEGVTYLYIQYSNLYLLAVTRNNTNATAILAFLHSLLEVFKHYFTELEEESLRDNFVIAYELLDEVCCRTNAPKSPNDSPPSWRSAQRLAQTLSSIVNQTRR